MNIIMLVTVWVLFIGTVLALRHWIMPGPFHLNRIDVITGLTCFFIFLMTILVISL